jgi:hypothetical protein
VDIEIKPGENLPDPFTSALQIQKYAIQFLAENDKYSRFYCSEYEQMTMRCEVNSQMISFLNLPRGEWIFQNVIMDTSKRDPQGKPTLIRMTYHPSVSLINIPFIVLPADGENNGEYIPEDTNEDLKHIPGTVCPYHKETVGTCKEDNCVDCPES